MTVQITIPVSNVVALTTLGYTKIEIWRSVDSGNSFTEITASTPLPAVLNSSDAQTTFNMGGREIRLKVNGGSEQSITFSSVLQQWTPTQVANRINEVVASLATVSGVHVVLTSPTTGQASTIEITYNDASDLGWFSGLKAFGLAARITLSNSVVIYPFTDLNGLTDYLYKWRFSANGTNPISNFSGSIHGSIPPISTLSLSIATANFASLSGQPLKTRVLIAIDDSPTTISGYVVGTDQPLIVDSDDLGFLQVPLIIGAKVRVAIEGTAFIREITVPNSPTFDLLTAMVAAPDPFTVQTTPPFLIRRSI